MIENIKLKVFRVVADTLNFRRTADELHLTQPAVTAQIKFLEESLGIALFDRISEDIRLTPAGTTLLDYVRHIGHEGSGDQHWRFTHDIWQGTALKVTGKGLMQYHRPHGANRESNSSSRGCIIFYRPMDTF